MKPSLFYVITESLQNLAYNFNSLAKRVAQGKQTLTSDDQAKFFDATFQVLDKKVLQLNELFATNEEDIQTLQDEIERLNHKLESQEKEIAELSMNGYFFK